jgi:hypothetical protein
MAKNKPSRMKSMLMKVGMGVVVLNSLLGGWSFFHLYWQSTGVYSLGKQVHRSDLIDAVLNQFVQGQAKK